MPDAIFLEMAQGDDAAASNGPYFLFLKFAFLEIPLIDLVVKGAVFPLIEGLYFEMSGAELILGMCHNPLQLHQMGAVVQLSLPFVEQVNLRVEFSFIVESVFPQQILFRILYAAQD